MNKKDLAIGLAVGLLVGTGIGFLGSGYLPGKRETSAEPTVSPTADVRALMTRTNCFVRMNEARLAAGVEQVPGNAQADRDAQLRADDIASGKTGFDHEGLKKYLEDGTFEVGYGEILSRSTSCTQAIKNFLDSPTHKDLMLKEDLAYVGVGVSGNILVILTHRKD